MTDFGLLDRPAMTPCLCGSFVSTRLDGCRPLQDAIDVLKEFIASEAKTKRGDSTLRRFEIEIERTDLLRWLGAQTVGGRTYFRNREGTLETVGVGCAVEFSAWEDPQLQQWMARSGDRCNGSDGNGRALFHSAGFFDAQSLGKHARDWAGFDRSRVHLPIVQITQATSAVLAVHVIGDPARAIDALEQCRPTGGHLALPRGLRATYEGDLVSWGDGIDSALGAIASGSIEKVVLARTRGYSALESIDPCAILRALIEEEPFAFHFLVEQVAGCAFIGASPERLFKRVGDRIHSESVAGTCGRGQDAASDDRLAGRLLASDKNRREHEIVVRQIERVLKPMVDRLECDSSPSVMRLRHVQHLVTAASGTLHSQIDDGTIIRELHPTPAVCGWPIEPARAFIKDHELMSRGLYAGVVGVASAGESDFSVALRSAVIVGTDMTAYSGAGIVRGSDADAEWLETERKLTSFEALVARGATEHQSQPLHVRADAHSLEFQAQVQQRMVAGS